MNLKKILFLLSNFRSGGAETQYANLVRYIDRELFEPVLGIIEYKQNIASDAFLARFGDVRLIKFRRCHVLDAALIFRVRKFILDNKIDYVQTQIFMDNQVGRLAVIGSRVPVITSIRGEYGAINGYFKTLFEFKAQFLSKNIVVNSAWLKSYVAEMGVPPDKIKIIYNGVDFNRYRNDEPASQLRIKYNLPTQGPIVSIIARLHPMKDHITFFDCVNIIKETYPDVIALIAGEGPELDSLKAYVKQLGLNDNIRFLGVVSENLAEVYKLSDVVVLTSQWGESFPNVILEAMSASIPVVASNISAIPEIISDGKNGFVVEKRNPRQFAEKINLLLSDFALRERFIDQAKLKVERFSIPAMVRKYEEIYDSLEDR